MIFDEEKIDGLIAQCRIQESIAALMSSGVDWRLRAGLYAISGDDRNFARAVDPELFACRSAAEVAEYYLAAAIESNAYDHIVAATVLAWVGVADGVYAALDAAFDRALAQRQFYLAVAARERLAAHALLFGDLSRARNAIDQAIPLSKAHGLTKWQLRCIAAGARLALEAGELEDAAQFVARGRAAASSPNELALLAGAGAQLAVENEEQEALAVWTSPSIVECALRSDDSDAVVSATIATVIAAQAPARGSPAANALRRALALSGDATRSPELFSIAARSGDLEDARYAVDALAAVFAPDRPYLRAHRLIARAHFLVRTGARAESVDSAGDAARAFSAIGSRRWTNEAMRLLVAQEPSSERRARARPGGSILTEREEQVAHLIRRGARNREVATALQISEHTVERHVSSILGRLGLRSRWQIADPARTDQA